MDNNPIDRFKQGKSNIIGLVAMALATVALIGAVVHLSMGPLAPQEPIERTIAQTALGIKEAAKRTIAGEAEPQPEPARRKADMDKIVDAAVLALAGAAMLLAIVALFRREERMPALIGFSLGGGVLLMSFLQWVAILICGAIILAAIISNLDQILS